MSERAPLTEAEREVERLCEVMHDAYEAAAVEAGWETQRRSRVPWADAPEANKATMRVAVRALLAARASTATADDGPEWDCDNFTEPVTCLSAGTTITGRCGRCRMRLTMAQETVRLAGATADTGLRERVEALVDEWDEVAATSAGYAAAREGLTDVAGLMDFSATMTRRANELRAALDAGAAPTADTGARDE